MIVLGRLHQPGGQVDHAADDRVLAAAGIADLAAIHPTGRDPDRALDPQPFEALADRQGGPHARGGRRPGAPAAAGPSPRRPSSPSRPRSACSGFPHARYRARWMVPTISRARARASGRSRSEGGRLTKSTVSRRSSASQAVCPASSRSRIAAGMNARMIDSCSGPDRPTAAPWVRSHEPGGAGHIPLREARRPTPRGPGTRPRPKGPRRPAWPAARRGPSGSAASRPGAIPDAACRRRRTAPRPRRPRSPPWSSDGFPRRPRNPARSPVRAARSVPPATSPGPGSPPAGPARARSTRRRPSSPRRPRGT